jgi:hypothetical protein
MDSVRNPCGKTLANLKKTMKIPSANRLHEGIAYLVLRGDRKWKWAAQDVLLW